MLVEGSKRLAQQAVKSLFPKETDGNLAIWVRGRKEGSRRSWNQLWIWLCSGVQKLAPDSKASLWGSLVNSWALGRGSGVGKSSREEAQRVWSRARIDGIL